MSDFFAGRRVTNPPIIELISTEIRTLAVGLSPAVVTGETIQTVGITSRLTNWRTGEAINALALVGTPSFNPTTKNASQRIDAHLLPRDDYSVLTITFIVNSVNGVETRAVYVLLRVTV